MAVKTRRHIVDAVGMADSATPAPDLFDEPQFPRPERKPGAISPLTHAASASEDGERLPLRWSPAAAAGAVGVAVALISNFPVWAVAVLGLAAGAMYLRTPPILIKRIWLIAVGSFFFAQCTTIFITPFTWVSRFLFCVALLASVTYFRVSGDE